MNEIETLTLGSRGPAHVYRHSGNSDAVQNHRYQAGVLQFIHHFQPFRHAVLRVNNARIMSIIVQMDVMIVVVFQPPAIKVKATNRGKQDNQGHNVKREVHKRQSSFLWQFPEVRGAIVRRVIFSFGRMILLFASDYNSVPRHLYRYPTRNCHRIELKRVSYTSTRRTPIERWR